MKYNASITLESIPEKKARDGRDYLGFRSGFPYIYRWHSGINSWITEFNSRAKKPNVLYKLPNQVE